MSARLLAVVVLGAALLWAVPASATYQCGNQKDTCTCGKNNPYPCCDNGSNCTWWSWHSACCNWAVGLPGWGNANTWAKYASQNGNYQVIGYPVPGSIGTSTKGTYGHVVWVTGVNGAKITVTEMNCCPSCNYGMQGKTYYASYFNSGYIIRKGQLGPVCGNGKCEGGENCANCGKDCGSCCGNGACDNGENCASCSKDCGACCGNGKCDNGESCASCSKDCGGCCGNGKCDNGENCSTCSKDCGVCCGNGACDYGETCQSCSKDCICLPEGALEAATCKAATGWAKEKDTDAKVKVGIKVDGVEQASLVADGKHTQHDGFGFAWTPAAQLKDAKAHDVVVDAFDTQSPGKATFGPRKFLCDNRITEDGPWTTQRTDSAGVDVLLPQGDLPRAALRHDHPAGQGYPLSGVLESCATFGVEPFEALRAKASWQLGVAPLRSTLYVDGKAVQVWQGDAKADVALELDKPGSLLCLRTDALSPVEAPATGHAELRDLELRRGPWWYTVSHDAAGWLLGVPAEDAVDLRGKGDGWPVPGRGLLRAWHDLPQPFDAVSYTLTSEGEPLGVEATAVVAELLVGDDAVPAEPGAHVVPAMGAQRFGVQVRAQGEVQLPPGLVRAFSKLRVHRNAAWRDGSWQLAREAAWGLDVGVAAPPMPDLPGLRLALNRVPMGWWATGVASARLELPGPPFERVRARVRRDFADAGLRLEIADEREVVWSTAGPGTDEVMVDLPMAGTVLTARLVVTQEAAEPPLARAAIMDLQLLRKKWWTAPSPDMVGLVDDRLPDGGVQLGVDAPWSQQGLETRGRAFVHRGFARQLTGVRFQYQQDLLDQALAVEVVLDGQVVRTLEQRGVYTGMVEILQPFSALGFGLRSREPAVLPEEWFARCSQIEVRGADGVWRGVDAEPSAVPGEPRGEDPAALGDAAGTSTAQSPPGAQPRMASGCGAAPVAVGSPVGWAVLLATGIALGRRRRGRAAS